MYCESHGTRPRFKFKFQVPTCYFKTNKLENSSSYATIFCYETTPGPLFLIAYGTIPSNIDFSHSFDVFARVTMSTSPQTAVYLFAAKILSPILQQKC